MSTKVNPLSLRGFAKSVNRGIQSLGAKLGRVDETVDLHFNEDRELMLANCKLLEKITEDMNKYLLTLRELSVKHLALCDDFKELYTNHEVNLFQASQKAHTQGLELEGVRKETDELFKKDFCNPLTLHLGQYGELKNRIEERHRRRIDMDRYHRKVEKLTKKPSSDASKLPTYTQKYNDAKRGYEELNNELMHDMPALVGDRFKFFDPLLATVIYAQTSYYNRCAKVMNELYPMIQHIDRGAAHFHQKVITQVSAAARPVYTGGKTGDTVDFVGADPTSGNGGKSTPPSSGGVPSSPSYGAAPGYAAAGGSAPPGYAQPAPGYAQPAPGYGAAPTSPHGAAPGGGHGPAGGRALPMPAKKKQARAMYPFQGQGPTELSFQPGEIMNIHKQDGDWWEAELNGRKGLVPANYVQLVE